MTHQEQLAKVLRTSPEVILGLENKMEKLSNKKRVIKKTMADNDKTIRRKLKELDLGRSASAEEVYSALIEKTKFCDKMLFKHFREPEFHTAVGCQTVINSTKELTGDLLGFYLKKEKAQELLRLNPPKNIMAALGYGADIEAMLGQENIFEIFCALRFVEEEKWLNDVFFKPYENLKKEDFEERTIQVMVLPERWLGIGKKFLGNKLHHMSHLKELGIVFVIPKESYGAGETLYFFFMTLHYLYETDWHAKLFKGYSSSKDFASKMISALKVEVTSFPLPNGEKVSWRIVAKYLAKKNPDDPRLAEPHVSSEAWFYTKTSLAIQRLASRFPDLGLDFWQGLDEAGEYFHSKKLQDGNLISFALYDNGIDLLKQSGIESKYLYHQQEALWNKIFIEYMGAETLEKLMIENFDKGFILLN